MKSLRIDFIEDQTWRYIWIATGAVLALMLIVYQVLGHKSSAERGELLQKLDDLQSTLLANSTAQPQDRRHGHALAIAGLLQTDLNKVFQTLETLKEPGIRLRQLQIDTASRQVRVEYEFSQLEKITAISGHLNSGYANHPWRFDGSTANADTARIQLMARDQLPIRGIWSCTLDQL